jgi:hypothetical protein
MSKKSIILPQTFRSYKINKTSFTLPDESNSLRTVVEADSAPRGRYPNIIFSSKKNYHSRVLGTWAYLVVVVTHFWWLPAVLLAITNVCGLINRDGDTTFGSFDRLWRHSYKYSDSLGLRFIKSINGEPSHQICETIIQVKWP